jgi:hypothetical protein
MVAPILAGFAFAILALVLVPAAKNEADPLRWRDPVLALLVAAALLLIISTQAAIRARMTMVKPDELMKWYPSAVDQDGKPDQDVRTRQRDLHDRTAKASNICRQTYNAGVLLLFTSIAVLLVPPSPVDDERRAVIVVALVAVAIEAAWLTGTSLGELRHWRLRPLALHYDGLRIPGRGRCWYRDRRGGDSGGGLAADVQWRSSSVPYHRHRHPAGGCQCGLYCRGPADSLATCCASCRDHGGSVPDLPRSGDYPEG